MLLHLPWDPSVLEKACELLRKWSATVSPATPVEYTDNNNTVVALENYRHVMAENLLRKFFLETSGSQRSEINLMNCANFSQSFTPPEVGIIGSPLPHLSANVQI